MLEYADPMLSFRRGVSGVLCAVGLLLSGACAARTSQPTTAQAPQQVVAPEPTPAPAPQPQRDPVQELIAQSEQHFQTGERELREGHLDAARAAFDRAVDIRRAVAFAKRNGMKPVIAGGAEAWVVADYLARENVPVLLDALANELQVLGP